MASNWPMYVSQLLACVPEGHQNELQVQVDRFEWHAFSSPLRCLQCLGPLAMILLCEVRMVYSHLWVAPRIAVL